MCYGPHLAAFLHAFQRMGASPQLGRVLSALISSFSCDHLFSLAGTNSSFTVSREAVRQAGHAHAARGFSKVKGGFRGRTGSIAALSVSAKGMREAGLARKAVRIKCETFGPIPNLCSTLRE